MALSINKIEVIPSGVLSEYIDPISLSLFKQIMYPILRVGK